MGMGKTETPAVWIRLLWKAFRYRKSTQGNTRYILFFLWWSVEIFFWIWQCHTEDFVWNSLLLPEDPRHRWRSSSWMIDPSTVVRWGGKRVSPGATQKEWARSSITIPASSIRWFGTNFPLCSKIILFESIDSLPFFLLYEFFWEWEKGAPNGDLEEEDDNW